MDKKFATENRTSVNSLEKFVAAKKYVADSATENRSNVNKALVLTKLLWKSTENSRQLNLFLSRWKSLANFR